MAVRAARITAARSNRRRCSTTSAIHNATHTAEPAVSPTNNCSLLKPRLNILLTPQNVRHIMPQNKAGCCRQGDITFYHCSQSSEFESDGRAPAPCAAPTAKVSPCDPAAATGFVPSDYFGNTQHLSLEEQLK